MVRHGLRRSQRSANTANTAGTTAESQPETNNAATATTTREIFECGTCSKDVGDRGDCIGCDKCEIWVHGTDMCSGLPQEVIDVIVGYSGEGIQFICMACRVVQASAVNMSPSAKSDSFKAETISQLFQQMRGLSAALTDLTAQVNALPVHNSSTPRPELQTECSAEQVRGMPASRQTNVGRTQPTHTVPSEGYRKIVREELKELQEREKRKDSVIIRGLEASSASDLVTKFSELTGHLMGTRVEVSDVRAIPSHPHIYRAKIMNANNRKLVLDNAKNLRGTRYDKVFINRDLTYAQRGELRERRLSRQAQEHASAETVPKSVGTPPPRPQGGQTHSSQRSAAGGGGAPPPGN